MAQVASERIQLNSGEIVCIRSGEESDASGMLAHVRRVLLDGEGMVLLPEEFEMTEEKEIEWIKGIRENPVELLLVVEHEGQIIGNIDFHCGKRKLLSHAGEFGMSLSPGWRGYTRIFRMCSF